MITATQYKKQERAREGYLDQDSEEEEVKVPVNAPIDRKAKRPIHRDEIKEPT